MVLIIQVRLKSRSPAQSALPGTYILCPSATKSYSFMWLMYDEGDSADNLECWRLVVHPNLVFGVGRTTFISSYFVKWFSDNNEERNGEGVAWQAAVRKKIAD